MSLDTRLEKFADILRKAVKYGPDDYNSDDDESGSLPAEITVEDEGASDLEVAPVMTEEDGRIEMIKERQRVMDKKRHDKAIQEHRDTSEVDMNVPVPGGLSELIKNRRNELEEAVSYLDNDEYDQDAVKAEVDKLRTELAELNGIADAIEEGTYTPPSEEAPAETPYDRATDVTKNQEAVKEMEETLEGVSADENTRKERERVMDVSIDDVLVLADSMYTKEEAQENVGDVDIQSLYKRVVDKFNQLNPDAQIKAANTEARIVTAQREEDPYTEYKEMTDAEKIDSATYVQLYALDKLFTKQLKEKAKSEVSDEVKDEEIDYEEIERNLDKALGRKPKEEGLHGPIKTFSPEEIARYESERAASVVTNRLSIRG